MYFQIREVVLWPRTGEHEPRRVIFELGRVNVITGWSKTGKSAIIPIIDYCLGAEKCAIPVKTIRDACEWFGIVVQTEYGQILLARREPGGSKSTGEMYMIEAEEIEIPNRIEGRRTTADAVKARLNELAGLTQLDFDLDETGAGFRGRPSFRDMSAFVFQPQNIIANPDVLFYKADTYDHREKLRTIFPYVLGAVTPRVLALQHEQHRLRIELRRKERELDAVRRVSERWIAELQSKISQARELGLVGSEVRPAEVEAMIQVLKQVVETGVAESRATAESIGEAATELVELDREENKVSSHLAHLKRRYAEMKRLRGTSGDFHGALVVKRDRLRIADWIRDLQVERHECPLCGTDTDKPRVAVEGLYQALRQTEQQIGDFAQMPAAFDREYQRIGEEIERSAEQLRGLGIRQRALQNASEEVRERQYSFSAAARFVGGLEEALLRYEQLGTGGELTADVEALRERVAGIDATLRQLDVRGAVGRALLRVSNHAGRVLPDLDVEAPSDPIRLSTDDLTVIVSGEDREDYLWEIGSGANWLGYHIAISLALHELFLENGHSPVPSFSVYDQPSQVYFPAQAEAPDETEAEEFSFGDVDVEAVKKTFRVLGNAARRWNGEWQAIVLDHADSSIWGDIPGIYPVEEWRWGKKLIPQTWLD